MKNMANLMMAEVIRDKQDGRNSALSKCSRTSIQPG